MKLQLKRPLVFLDLETTGLNTEEDRIVEISMLKIFTTGNTKGYTFRINPTIPISEGAFEVHGISNEDVKDCPQFIELSGQIWNFIHECDLAGYNSLHFDFPLLRKEFERAGIFWDYSGSHLVDVGNIVKIQNPRNLAAAYKLYCNKELTEAHHAEADTLATKEIFFEQIKREDVPGTIEEIAKYSNYDQPLLDLSGKFTINADGVVVFAFGQHRNEPAMDHLDYIEWMYSRDFPEDTKRICRTLLDQHSNDTF